MDRQQIERRDFPTGEHGLDPAAVAEHLRRVADAFEARPSLADGMSERVRTILEAAEESAAELRAQAARHVTHVRETADSVLADLTSLLTELHERAERLSARLAALEAGAAPPPQPAAAAGPAVAGGPAAPLPAVAADRPAPPAAAGDPAAPLAPDDAGARLVALNMALDGSPRADTARYLAAHFALADPGALLDDVYARAGR